MRNRLDLWILTFLVAGAAVVAGQSGAAKPPAKPAGAVKPAASKLTVKPAAAVQVKPVDFKKEVRPILSDYCFHCHGPDQKTRMAGLRLDTQEGVLEKRKTGAPVVPGNPKLSLVYQRITSEVVAKRMPPEYAHKNLSPAQIDILKRWIQTGAEWKEHWAFVAPVKRTPPVVKKVGWARNPIDKFLLAKMEASGLAPAPEADRRTLARRASFDLTGLPPTPEMVEAFIADKAPNAYERYVDKLMAMPEYGEHRARYWLDAARYADTHGIHVDNFREMWPYRDWVINAFNRNMPYDKFTIEQLAGDLLPNPTMDQLIATGFHRCNPTTNEAGIILEEFDAIYAKDRVDTTGAVWMGLTIGCATCHDHKFDPIKQKDFYAMTAFFRNTTQHTMDGNVPDTPPILVVPTDADRERWAQIRVEDEATRKKMEALRTAASPTFDGWLASGARASVARPLPGDAESVVFDLAKQQNLIDSPVPGRKAVEFKKESPIELANQKLFDSGNAFSIAVWIRNPMPDGNFTIASQLDPKDKRRGWSVDLAARLPGLRLVGDDGKNIEIRSGHLEQLKPGEWAHLVFTYDGSREQPGMAMYVNGASVPTQGRGNQTTELPGSLYTSEPLKLGPAFEGGAIADFRVFNRVLSEEEAKLVWLWPTIETARAKAAGELTAAERDALRLYYQQHNDQEYQTLASKLVAYEAERRGIRKRGGITHVMNERTDQTPMAHVLYRGAYDQKRDKVEPAVPSALPQMPASFPKNRMGLAKWIVDPSNPLTARVTVNRYWLEIFGTGLVKTAEDFGSQGEPPSHPELLDWLAVDFRENGWDVKRLVKMMVTSAAYRQSAQTTPEKIQKDPDNRLLAHGPRFRMDAEMVRDNALAASGMLVKHIGGPSVKPYQPDGIWEAVAMIGSNTRFYKQDSGDKLYRRSLYTFWKRSAPPPAMDIFNAPTREMCTVRRERTNTPLQALMTLNDVQFVEASRHLAERALKAGTQFDAQLEFITRNVLARPFDEREKAVAAKAYKDFLSYYDSNPADAKKLIEAGESTPDRKLPAPEFAAMTMLASQVLNLDETLNK